MPTPTFDTLSNAAPTKLTAPYTVGDTYITVKSVTGFTAPCTYTAYQGLSELAQTIYFRFHVTSVDTVNKRLYFTTAAEGTTLVNLRTGTMIAPRLVAGQINALNTAVVDLYTAGTQGPQGYQGAAGSQGAQGASGATGVQGAQGANGSNGAQGFQGFQGVAGSNGAQGFQGAAGAQGSQGAQGANGSSSIGGSVGSGTTGSVLFVGSSSTLAQDNSNLFFDDTNNRLGINTNGTAPTRNLEVWSSTSVPTIRVANGTSTSYPNNAWNIYAVDGNGMARLEAVRTGTIVYADTFRIENNYSEQQITMNRVISTSSAEKVGIQLKSDFDSSITGTGKPVAVQILVNTDSSTTTAVKKFLDCKLTSTSKFSVDINGRVKIGTVTSDPSDTPDTGTTVYNTANDKLWIYNGSAWKSVTLS